MVSGSKGGGMFVDDSNPPEVRVIPRHQRPLVLVCQAMVGEVSGGHVFNQRMILEAQRSEVPLRALTPEQVLDGEGAEASVFLWDSLDIPLLAASGITSLQGSHGLFVHFLPFENPLVEASERLRWREQFDRVVAHVDFMMTTGVNARERIQGLWPQKPCGLVVPGVSDDFSAARPSLQGRSPLRVVQIATVAGLVNSKRLLPLLEMLASCRGDWHWHVVSGLREPECQNDFIAALKRFNLRQRVTLYDALGHAAMARVLADMDLFAYFSAEEVYGMALAEATAIGLPVVTTDVGDAAMLVEHGKTGWVFRVGDDAGFQEGLQGLIGDAGRRASFRLAALARGVRPVSWSESLRSMLEFIEPWRSSRDNA